MTASFYCEARTVRADDKEGQLPATMCVKKKEWSLRKVILADGLGTAYDFKYLISTYQSTFKPDLPTDTVF